MYTPLDHYYSLQTIPKLNDIILQWLLLNSAGFLGESSVVSPGLTQVAAVSWEGGRGLGGAHWTWFSGASPAMAEVIGMDHVALHLGHLHTTKEALPEHTNETTGPLWANTQSQSHSHSILLVKAHLRANLESRRGKQTPPLDWKSWKNLGSYLIYHSVGWVHIYLQLCPSLCIWHVYWRNHVTSSGERSRECEWGGERKKRTFHFLHFYTQGWSMGMRPVRWHGAPLSGSGESHTLSLMLCCHHPEVLNTFLFEHVFC